MSTWLPVVLSSAGGVAATLLGAVTGGAIAGRSQRMHWRRDKQIDACTAITAESTRTQLALRRRWRYKEQVDWNGWNQALAMISLVGTPNAIKSVDEMDAVFWQSTSEIKGLKPGNEQGWSQIVHRLETARLDFINVARREIVGLDASLERLPIARPPLNKPVDQPTAEPSSQ